MRLSLALLSASLDNETCSSLFRTSCHYSGLVCESIGIDVQLQIWRKVILADDTLDGRPRVPPLSEHFDIWTVRLRAPA